MRIRVAQIGARRHYAVPIALHGEGMLELFHTDWCGDLGFPGLIAKLAPSWLNLAALRRIRDRRIPKVPANLIRSHMLHAVRMAALRHAGGLPNADYWARANADFGERVVRAGFGNADAVYGFNAASVEIFAAARQQGLRTILDQTMAPWEAVERLLVQERLRWPEWTAAEGEQDSSRVLADREAREWETSDLIICGSQYVVDTLGEVGAPVQRCRIVPYGYSRTSEAGPFAEGRSKATSSGPLKVLFVGTVDLRKGVPYLLQAAQEFDPGLVQFRVVGPLAVSDSAIDRLKRRVEVIGAVSRSGVHEHYEWADVFVLPTLAEGSANVCFEALAHGVPVMTTPNAGSVVRDGIEGWIIPPRSSAAIVERLRELVDDRDRLREASDHARPRAAEFTWDRYMQSLTTTIAEAFRPSAAAEVVAARN